jgi:hypothetical protein
LAERAKALLETDFHRCNCKPYNDFVLFPIVTRDDTEWSFDGAGRVRINCNGETNPKQIPGEKSWAAQLQAIWEIKEAAFIESKVSRVLCGSYPEEQ